MKTSGIEPASSWILSWPQVLLGLDVNSCLNQKALTLMKRDLVGVNLQVNEVKKVNFHVYFKKYLLKHLKTFCKNVLSTADSCPSAWYGPFLVVLVCVMLAKDALAFSAKACWALFSLSYVRECGVCVCGGPKEPRLPRILHSCLDVLWHSRPTAVFCFPGPRAYFERHSHGQHNRSTLSLSHTHSSTTHSTTYISWRRHRIPFQIWEKTCVY